MSCTAKTERLHFNARNRWILEIDVKIRLMENFRAIFYAPYYAIHALDFYANEGVDVELVSSEAPGDAIAHLANGTIDLTWGGPMRVMTAHDRDDQSPLVCFGEVVSRAPPFCYGLGGSDTLDVPTAGLAGSRY